MRRTDGSWGWYVLHSRRTADGLTAAIMRDVTLEREVQESLTDMVNTDPLTGLANRRGWTFAPVRSGCGQVPPASR